MSLTSPVWERKTLGGSEEASHLAEAVKEHVEVWEDRASGHLDYVIEGLAGIVPQPAVGIIETRQHRLNQLLQVEPRVLGDRRRLVSWGPHHREKEEMLMAELSWTHLVDEVTVRL